MLPYIVLRTQISLTPEDRRMLDAAAARTGKSISALIREAVATVYGAEPSSADDLTAMRRSFRSWTDRDQDGGRVGRSPPLRCASAPPGIMTGLVDTSVLINYLRGHDGASVVLEQERVAGRLHASQITRLEILAGTRAGRGPGRRDLHPARRALVAVPPARLGAYTFSAFIDDVEMDRARFRVMPLAQAEETVTKPV